MTVLLTVECSRRIRVSKAIAVQCAIAVPSADR
jgi:hypothetical protein